MKFRWVLVAALLGALLTAVVAAPSAGAWPPISRATIRPGVQLVTDGSQCTGNFIYRYFSRAFIGMAAHCAGTGGQTDTNGCLTGSLPLGTPVEIQGASRPGWLHYSSWFTMHQVGEADPDICRYNDFALVEIHPADVTKVNPSVPFWGGPTGLNRSGTREFSSVYGYGNSWLRFGALPQKAGTSLGDIGNGWAHMVYTVTPSIPGDSGGGLLDERGRAVGVATTISALTTNTFVDVNHALGYAATRAGVHVTVVPGTTRFVG